MTKGFYNLTSGILSQSRRLDTVANNMTNLSTSGYKAEQYTGQHLPGSADQPGR